MISHPSSRDPLEFHPPTFGAPGKELAIGGGEGSGKQQRESPSALGGRAHVQRALWSRAVLGISLPESSQTLRCSNRAASIFSQDTPERSRRFSQALPIATVIITTLLVKFQMRQAAGYSADQLIWVEAAGHRPWMWAGGRGSRLGRGAGLSSEVQGCPVAGGVLRAGPGLRVSWRPCIEDHGGGREPAAQRRAREEGTPGPPRG